MRKKNRIIGILPVLILVGIIGFLWMNGGKAEAVDQPTEKTEAPYEEMPGLEEPYALAYFEFLKKYAADSDYVKEGRQGLRWLLLMAMKSRSCC